MFTWDLPQTLEVGGRMYEIRTDFRPALDILVAFNDPELPEENKIQVMMEILFVELPPEEYLNEAVERAYWYLDCGKRSDGKAGPRVMDWEQDASMIFSAINKVAGYEVRNPQRYTHWWTFAGYFDEIDECIIFKWNRVYPADQHLDIDISKMTKVQEEEFVGFSHEKITMEVYER